MINPNVFGQLSGYIAVDNNPNDPRIVRTMLVGMVLRAKGVRSSLFVVLLVIGTTSVTFEFTAGKSRLADERQCQISCFQTSSKLYRIQVYRTVQSVR